MKFERKYVFLIQWFEKWMSGPIRWNTGEIPKTYDADICLHILVHIK